jgi:hypothetical protein
VLLNDDPQPLRIVGAITAVETIVEGSGIRELSILRARHGGGRWNKKKGIAMVQHRMALPVWPKSTGIV